MLEEKAKDSRLLYFVDYPYGREKIALEKLKELSSLGIKLLFPLAKGYRGVVFKGKDRAGREVAVKFKRADSQKDFINKEVEILNYLSDTFKKLNLPVVFPKVLKKGKEFFVMDYVAGTPILEVPVKERREALISALYSCYYLDLAGVNHGEIKGGKHLIYNPFEKKTYVIDFESARFTETPRNLLQFLGYYLIGKGFLNGIDKRKLMEMIKFYKENPKEGFKGILKLLEIS